ncbi:MAG: hypothetical protein IT288_06735 [Bdellovibrionales bacterium]|nr:hypothetical protein [Bdellovibrionales bacterium]
MDRKLLIGALALLFIEITLLLGDLGVLPFDPLHLRPTPALTREIGRVVNVNQSVRRKVQGSLIWENSTADDQLYAFDSILTLTNSSAKVQLQGDVQLQLNENTLVVLEPLSQDRLDHLRLRFTRGTLRSRAGQKNLQLATGEWTLDAQAGSEISLRTLDDGKLELEVSAGQVALNRGAKDPAAQSFASGDKLTLSENAVQEVLRVSPDLKWQMTGEYLRIYSYQFPAFIHLRWQGSAQQLRTVTQSGDVSTLKLTAEQRELTLPLSTGTHYLSLQDQTQTSSTFPVSVWPAEGLHYLSPLPRDRLPLSQDYTFSWSPSDQARSYRLQIAANEDFSSVLSEQPSDVNQVNLSLPTPGSLYWRVVGVDSEGFLIPPLYAQQFYVVDRPLAAPKLRAPSSRLPASKKQNTETAPPQVAPPPPAAPTVPPAAPTVPPGQPGARLKWQKLWQWLFPTAHAQTDMADQAKAIAQEAAKSAKTKARSQSPTAKQQVVFSWYPVPEAEYYIIEISATPDFAKPVVAEKISKEEFVWSQFERRPYYWRVAAGQENGRMGLFSEASEVDLARLSDTNLSELAPGVSVVSTPAPPPKPAPTTPPPPPTQQQLADPKPTPSPAPTPVAIESPPVPLRKVEQEHSFRFVFAPESAQLKHQNKNQVEGQLNGSSQVTVESEVSTPLEEKGRLVFHFRLSSYEWEPQTPTQVPLQESLASWNLRSRFMHFPARRNWGYGVAVHRSALLERDELETVRFKEHLTYGGSLAYLGSLGERSQWEVGLWLTTGDSILATQLTNHLDYRYPAWGILAVIGLGIDGILETGSKDVKNSGGTVSVRLGFEW